MALRQVSLDDKYDLTRQQVFVTGSQAIIRLCLMQKERDRRAGLNTAGYVSGYRGSPLGGLDLQFQRTGRLLAASDIKFLPGQIVGDPVCGNNVGPPHRSCRAKWIPHRKDFS